MFGKPKSHPLTYPTLPPPKHLTSLIRINPPIYCQLPSDLIVTTNTSRLSVCLVGHYSRSNCDRVEKSPEVEGVKTSTTRFPMDPLQRPQMSQGPRTVLPQVFRLRHKPRLSLYIPFVRFEDYPSLIHLQDHVPLGSGEGRGSRLRVRRTDSSPPEGLPRTPPEPGEYPQDEVGEKKVFRT